MDFAVGCFMRWKRRGSRRTTGSIERRRETVPATFLGTLRVTPTLNSMAMLGLRGRTNERDDFLTATTPPFNFPFPGNPDLQFIFPHVPVGGGFSTQFILLPLGVGSPSNPQTGVVNFFDSSGNPLGLVLQY
jgi:hypothetical protein